MDELTTAASRTSESVLRVEASVFWHQVSVYNDKRRTDRPPTLDTPMKTWYKIIDILTQH